MNKPYESRAEVVELHDKSVEVTSESWYSFRRNSFSATDPDGNGSLNIEHIGRATAVPNTGEAWTEAIGVATGMYSWVWRDTSRGIQLCPPGQATGAMLLLPPAKVMGAHNPSHYDGFKKAYTHGIRALSEARMVAMGIYFSVEYNHHTEKPQIGNLSYRLEGWIDDRNIRWQVIFDVPDDLAATIDHKNAEHKLWSPFARLEYAFCTCFNESIRLVEYVMKNDLRYTPPVKKGP